VTYSDLDACNDLAVLFGKVCSGKMLESASRSGNLWQQARAAAGRELLMLRSETAYTAAANASHLLRGPFSRLLGRRSNAAQFLDKATEGAQCCLEPQRGRLSASPKSP